MRSLMSLILNREHRCTDLNRFTCSELSRLIGMTLAMVARCTQLFVVHGSNSLGIDFNK
jgi:hypothetical protein